MANKKEKWIKENGEEKAKEQLSFPPSSFIPCYANQPSLRRITRWPYSALDSECVTCTIVTLSS